MARGGRPGPLTLLLYGAGLAAFVGAWNWVRNREAGFRVVLAGIVVMPSSLGPRGSRIAQ